MKQKCRDGHGATRFSDSLRIKGQPSDGLPNLIFCDGDNIVHIFLRQRERLVGGVALDAWLGWSLTFGVLLGVRFLWVGTSKTADGIAGLRAARTK